MITSQEVLQVGVAASVLTVVGGLLAMRHMQRQKRFASRFDQVRLGRAAGEAPEQSAVSPRHLLRVIASIGQSILRSGIVSSQTIDSLQKSLEAAGVRSANAVALFITGKIMLAIVLPIVVIFGSHSIIANPTMRNMLLAGSAVGGLLAPDYIVRSLRKRYQKGVSNGLPDALDMLVMCAESGLSLEPAIQRVGLEIQSAHPEVGGELLLTANEFQLSTDSTAVLNALGERTGLPEVKRVVATLAQTLQYGTPLAEALRVLSAEMRT
ncbi:MAG: type II secretion system F family protein, partial [Nevskiales bacterium]